MKVVVALVAAMLVTTLALAAGPRQVAAADGASAGPLKVVIAVTTGRKAFEELAKHLEANYNATVGWIEAEKGKPFGDLSALDDADVILSCIYRTEATPEQLAALKKAFLGKPVVGMRRAHHGFQNWLEADREVFGVTYKGHYFGNNVQMTIAPGKEHHPLVEGVETFLPAGGIYQHLDPAEGVEVLMVGAPEGEKLLPQTWLRINRQTGQRVFYTRYDPEDMKDVRVRDMVVRALIWAAGRDARDLRKP
jgi:type 1 glutamine amidotransferase